MCPRLICYRLLYMLACEVAFKLVRRNILSVKVIGLLIDFYLRFSLPFYLFSLIML